MIDRVKEKLEGSLYEYIEDENRKWKETHGYKKGEYHVHSLPKCLRSQFYQWTVPRKYPPALQRKFQTGHAFHDHAYKVLEKYIIDTEQDVAIPVTDEVKIVGRYDARCQFSKKQYLVDVKSIEKLEYVDKYGVDEGYVEQLNTYLGSIALKIGYLLYVERPTYQLSAIRINFDHHLFERTKQRAMDLHNALVTDMVPEAERSFKCDGCLWRDLCEECGK